MLIAPVQACQSCKMLHSMAVAVQVVIEQWCMRSVRDFSDWLLSVFYSEFLGKTPGSGNQKWVPSRSTKRDGSSGTEKERHDAIFRKVRG